MDAPARLLFALLAIAALAASIALLYPRLAGIHTEQPPVLEVHVLRVTSINNTLHILVELIPHEPVWLTRWCLGGHCYQLTGSVSSPTLEDLIDVDHAYKPGEKLVVCYQRLEAGQAPPARCVSLRLP